jgi:hypothetical protein
MYRANLTPLTANSSICEGAHPSATFQMSHLSSEDWKEVCCCVLFWGGWNNTDKTDSDVSEHPACSNLTAFQTVLLNQCTTFHSYMCLRTAFNTSWHGMSCNGMWRDRVPQINLLTPELNPSAQRCLTWFFTGDFASWTVHFVNICVKNQQMQQLLIQFINYVW